MSEETRKDALEVLKDYNNMPDAQKPPCALCKIDVIEKCMVTGNECTNFKKYTNAGFAKKKKK